jgi:hypothetical protein
MNGVKVSINDAHLCSQHTLFASCSGSGGAPGRLAGKRTRGRAARRAAADRKGYPRHHHQSAEVAPAGVAG